MATEAVEASPPPTTSLMRVLRGTDEAFTGRLTGRHLDARDNALAQIRRASEAVTELEALERGELRSEVLSPRYDEVRRVKQDLEHLRDRLDGVYV